MRPRDLVALSALLLPIRGVAQSPEHPSFVVEVVGSGPDMILVPGLTSPGSVWARTVEQYKSRYTLHVLTLAGFADVPPVAHPSLARVRDEIIEYIRGNRLDRPIMVGHLSPLAARSDPATMGQFCYELYVTDLREAVASIAVPILLLVGTAGIAVVARPAYIASARRQLANMSHVEIREIPTARHFIQLDNPSALHVAMDAFIARLK